MPTIKVLGLGAGDWSQLPRKIEQELLQATNVYLRTGEHPGVEQLESKGISYTTFDTLYLTYNSFEEVYERIVSTLQQELIEKEVLHYVVPGHPIVAERTVQLLLQGAQEGGYQVEIIGGQSFIDPMLTAVQADPAEGLLILDGTSLQSHMLHPQCHTLITQVYDAIIASEIKLTLMEVYPDDYKVELVTAAGTAQESTQSIPLYELDRVTSLSNLTALYLPRTEEEGIINRQYYRSRDIFRQLRGPDGCPWDREQTHQSLRKYVLEEANELVEAIDQGDVDHMIEELGDVLLQVFLHAQIGEDEGYFTMEDVIESLNTKMIRRHPHVFGDVQLESKEDVLKQWRIIKEKEQKDK